MFEYLLIAMIYTQESSTNVITTRVVTQEECQQVADTLKSMEENVDYKCLKVRKYVGNK